MFPAGDSTKGGTSYGTIGGFGFNALRFCIAWGLIARS